MAVSAQDNPIARRIFQAAVSLFASKGYAATSTREIVEGAEVTKPMLYYYFESKEGLCRAMLAHFLEPLFTRFRHAAEGSRDPEENLVEFIAAHFDFCRDNRDFARLFYALYFGPDEQSAELDLEGYKQRFGVLLVEAARHACQSGLVRPDKEQAFSMALQGMINIWIMKALKERAELSRGLARSIVEDLLQGFGQSSRKTKA